MWSAQQTQSEGIHLNAHTAGVPLSREHQQESVMLTCTREISRIHQSFKSWGFPPYTFYKYLQETLVHMLNRTASVFVNSPCPWLLPPASCWRRRWTYFYASQPQAIHWTWTQPLHPNPNLRTHSILSIGAGSRDGPPYSLTCVLTCYHSAGNLLLRSSIQTASPLFKGLWWFVICMRMFTTLNGFVAHCYLPNNGNSRCHHRKMPPRCTAVPP